MNKSSKKIKGFRNKINILQDIINDLKFKNMDSPHPLYSMKLSVFEDELALYQTKLNNVIEEDKITIGCTRYSNPTILYDITDLTTSKPSPDLKFKIGILTVLCCRHIIREASPWLAKIVNGYVIHMYDPFEIQVLMKWLTYLHEGESSVSLLMEHHNNLLVFEGVVRLLSKCKDINLSKSAIMIVQNTLDIGHRVKLMDIFRLYNILI
jgi:hypothetical protein